MFYVGSAFLFYISTLLIGKYEIKFQNFMNARNGITYAIIMVGATSKHIPDIVNGTISLKGIFNILDSED
jgi:hypothetical protein